MEKENEFLRQMKSTIPTFDEEHSSNFFDYTAPAHLAAIQQQQREEYQKKHLPPIRGLKVFVMIDYKIELESA